MTDDAYYSQVHRFAVERESELVKWVVTCRNFEQDGVKKVEYHRAAAVDAEAKLAQIREEIHLLEKFYEMKKAFGEE